jgi:nitrite reductase (NADH) large subunit
MTRAVVVGAGPAGTRSAEKLALGGAAVTLLGEEPGLPYDRVALSKYLAGDVHEHELVTHREAELARLGILHIHSVRATAIDRLGRSMTLSDGRSLDYDAAVLATGSDPFRLPLPGADLSGVLMYRTLADVQGMLRAAAAGGRAIVIGGGLLGLEAAVGLAKRGMDVTVLHAVDRLMERQLDTEAAARLRAHLQRTGIVSVLEARSVAVTGTARATGIALSDGTRIAADLVVMAVGIRPRVALAREAGLKVARGIVVDGAMRTSDPHIFAVGECAEVDGVCCGLVAPAFAQAETAARVILGEDASYVAESDATVLKVAGAPVWSAGEIDATDADSIVLDEPEGTYRRLLIRDDRLVGAILWGDTEDAAFYRNLIRRNHDVSLLRSELAFGAAFAPPELRS